MSVLHLIASSDFIAVNRTIARRFGLDEAVLLGELASEFVYFESRDMLDDGCFFSTVENVEENTTLSDYRQRKALKTLQDAGVIEVVRKGLPAKRYIRIIESQVLALFDSQISKNYRSVSQNSGDLEGPEFDANKNREREYIKDNKEKETRHRYGEYGNVLLSDSDLAKLKDEFPDWQDRIERLSAYMASTGKSYKSHLATIRNWARRASDDGVKSQRKEDKEQPEWSWLDFVG